MHKTVGFTSLQCKFIRSWCALLLPLELLSLCILHRSLFKPAQERSVNLEVYDSKLLSHYDLNENKQYWANRISSKALKKKKQSWCKGFSIQNVCKLSAPEFQHHSWDADNRSVRRPPVYSDCMTILMWSCNESKPTYWSSRANFQCITHQYLCTHKICRHCRKTELTKVNNSELWKVCENGQHSTSRTSLLAILKAAILTKLID